MKFLIVDDSEDARQMIKYYLLELTDEFRECADGADAAFAYAEFLPDWVLMDCEMQRVNGLAATRNIVADHPAAKILMVTNHSENDLRQAATEAGAVDLVTKDDLFFLHTFLKNEITN